jgi:ATP-dependent Clp protease ATP-binding subunit ClpA
MQFGKGVQFDRAAWLAKFRAKREAEKLQSESVGARHLLLGLLSLDNGLMRQVFAQFGDDVADKVIDVARKSLKPTASPKRSLSEDKNWQAVMKRAEGLARETALMTETDLATALLETPSRVDEVLKRVGLTQQQCLDKLRALIAKGVITSGWHSAGFTDD